MGEKDYPTTAESFAGQVEWFFGELERLVDKACKVFNKLVNYVRKLYNDWGDLLPESTWEAINKNIENWRRVLKKIIDLAKRAVRHYWPYISLVYASFAWLDNVQSPFSELTSKAKGDADRRLSSWSGDAGSAYKDYRELQGNAISDVAAKAGAISGWLEKVSKANYDYMSALVVHIAEFAAAIIVPVEEGVSIVGLPFAIQDTAKAVAETVTTAAKLIKAAGDRFTASLTHNRDLKEKMGNFDHLPERQWPQLVTNPAWLTG